MIIIRRGDVYCPRCLREDVQWMVEKNRSTLLCAQCGKIDHPYVVDDDGVFTWDWNAQYPRPNPGCPFCGTCNISFISGEPIDGRHYYWWCNRDACRKTWWGFWTISGDGSMRWTIRLRAKAVR